MADYSTRFSRNGAFSFEVETITDIAKAASRFLGKEATISIDLVDDHEIEDTDLAVLLADSYVKNKLIKRISIEGFGEVDVKNLGATRRHVSVALGHLYGSDSPVTVSISGDRDACVAVRTEIENTIRGAELWYSNAYMLKSPYSEAVSVPAAMLAAAIVSGLITLLFIDDLKNPYFFAWAFSLCLPVLFALVFLKRKLFPKSLFDIGHSAKRIQYAKYFRQLVFVTILLGVALKVVADKLFK